MLEDSSIKCLSRKESIHEDVTNKYIGLCRSSRASSYLCYQTEVGQTKGKSFWGIEYEWGRKKMQIQSLHKSLCIKYSQWERAIFKQRTQTGSVHAACKYSGEVKGWCYYFLT